MLFQDAELHNVEELLEGSVEEIIGTEGILFSDMEWERKPGEAADGLWLTRLPDSVRRQVNVAARVRSLEGTGCEIRFNLEGDAARIVLKSLVRPSIVEVYQGPFLSDWHVVQREPTEIVVRLPERIDLLRQLARERQLAFDPGLTRIMLPWRPAAKILSLSGDFHPPDAGQTPHLRYLAYGSSITQGNSSVRPTATYASRVAELLGADLINKGFGGGAHLDQGIADAIAARDDFDVATLEMGINVIGTIEVAEFQRRVDTFVDAIVAAHPDRPVVCIDLLPSFWDWQDPLKVSAFREVVRRKVARIGLPSVTYIPGDSLLFDMGGLCADVLHPSARGMEQIATNLSRRLAPLLPK